VAVLYRVFLDDSADGKQEQFMLAAGLIGRQKQWNDFGRTWKIALRTPPAIKHFHSKEWRSLKGEFAQFANSAKYPKPKGYEAANDKRAALKEVIRKSKIVGVGIGILVPDYELVRNADPGAAEFFCPDPYAFVLQSIFLECAKVIRRTSKLDSRGSDGHCVGFVSDDGPKAHIYTALYHDFKQKNPLVATIMRGIAHLDDKKWPGLQAADLLAHVTNQIYKQELAIPEDERCMLDSLPELQGTFWKIAKVDKYYLCSVLEDIKGISLWEKLGIKRREYKSDEELDQAKGSGRLNIKAARGRSDAK
jgi:hypothetical protein